MDARCYFDKGRSRIVTADDAWFDVSEFPEEVIQSFCERYGIEFFDHRIDHHPEWLRRPLLQARAAAKGRRKLLAFFSLHASSVQVATMPQTLPTGR